MKKSMIATAVVATAGLAASANAGYFVISNAAYTPAGGSGQSLSVPELETGNFSDAGLAGFDFSDDGGSPTSAGNAYSMTNTTANAIRDALAGSGTLSNGTLYYFGFEATASGPGYFGFLFMGNGASIEYSVANANRADEGVWSNHATSNSFATGSLYVGTTATTTVGQAYVSIFANLDVGESLGGSTVTDTNFDVSYLSFDGSDWVNAASAGGVESSSLNTAMYAVPVPAPALLAGAGLVGAAALRRRMAKKA